MKRIPVFLVLAMVVLAVAASPSYAYRDAQSGGPVVTAPHAAAVSQGGNAGSTTEAKLPSIGGRAAGSANRAVQASHSGTASHDGTALAIGLLLTFVAVAGILAIVAYRRRRAPVPSGKELPSFRRQRTPAEAAAEAAADQSRKAA